MKTGQKIVVFLLFALCLVSGLIFGTDLLPIGDKLLSRLLSETVPRLFAAAALAALLLVLGYRELLLPPSAGRRALLWCLPCLFVALANFPYSALISGTATLERPDLLPLFLLKCLSVALLEELFFRGILLPLFAEKFGRPDGKNETNGTSGTDEAREGRARLVSVLLGAALFALMHLFNLFFGASVGGTLLQVGYTFLIGCMLGAVFFRTKNVWLCVLLHFVFDVGGLIVTDLGSGAFQDPVFWTLTAVFGVLCAVHVAVYLLRIKRQP